MNKKAYFSFAAVVVMTFTAAAPSFAYRFDKPPFPTTHLRRSLSLRDAHVTHKPVVDRVRLFRTAAVEDLSGRSHLARAKMSVRHNQRNLNRHMLGWSRSGDYRVLNTRGDLRRRNLVRGKDLPPTVISAGGVHRNFGTWMWDRPTRRDIRENKLYRVNDRNRDLLKEIDRSVRGVL